MQLRYMILALTPGTPIIKVVGAKPKLF